MSSWRAVVIAILGGGILATFLYQLVGLAAFGVTALFGVDDELWQYFEGDSAVSSAIIVLVLLVCWLTCGLVIWGWLKRRV